MAGFVEYRHIGTSDPLRQGDILESADGSASRWQRNLVVITADCDFANDKHHGRVTCVPLLAAEEYLAEMQIPRLRERLVKKPLESLRSLVAESPHPDVSAERLREWALEQDAEVIIQMLEIPEGKTALGLQAVAAIKLIDSNPISFNDAITSLIEGQLVGPNPPKAENARKSVLQPLCDVYARPPGDALFLSSIGPSHEDGYFAYLRHFEQIAQSDIATAPLHRTAQYRRIARLQDRFILALVQQFGMVFMSIGLPPEYEEIRDLHSETLGERFA